MSGHAEHPTAEFAFAPLEPIAAEAVPQDPAGEARAIVAQARAEADAIRAAAHEEGFQAGLAAAQGAVGPAIDALDALSAGLHEDQVARADRLERHAVELGFALAEKIVGVAVAADHTLVVEAVRGALRALVERERVTVLVHPDDLELVRAAIGELAAGLGGIDHCDVQVERRMVRGGAIVRTADGDLDARIEEKLERARDVLATVLGA